MAYEVFGMGIKTKLSYTWLLCGDLNSRVDKLRRYKKSGYITLRHWLFPWIVDSDNEC